MAQGKSSKASGKTAVRSSSKPSRKSSARKSTNTEPITEGPYANSGPEYEARIKEGAKKPEGDVKVRLVPPGSVTV